MREEYVSKIIDMLHKLDDIAFLDLIYRLLIKKCGTTSQRKHEASA